MGGMPNPRSLIFDLVGEYLRFGEGYVWLGQLTQLLGDFEVAPATVRMTLTRLRREGWVTSERQGRETRYRPTEQMLEVLDEGRARIFAQPPTEWSGQWTMVIYHLTEGERTEREQLRKRLSYQGFGRLGSGVWLAAGDRRDAARALTTGWEEGRVEVFRVLSEGIDHDVALSRRCWDLEPLAAAYQGFVDAHDHLRADAATLTGADALVARTLLVASYRQFPFDDPQLPPPVRPEPWPGVAAHELLSSAHTALGPAARAHVADVIGREVADTGGR